MAVSAGAAGETECSGGNWGRLRDWSRVEMEGNSPDIGAYTAIESSTLWNAGERTAGSP